MESRWGFVGGGAVALPFVSKDSDSEPLFSGRNLDFGLL